MQLTMSLNHYFSDEKYFTVHFLVDRILGDFSNMPDDFYKPDL